MNDISFVDMNVNPDGTTVTCECGVEYFDAMNHTQGEHDRAMAANEAMATEYLVTVKVSISDFPYRFVCLGLQDATDTLHGMFADLSNAVVESATIERMV